MPIAGQRLSAVARRRRLYRHQSDSYSIASNASLSQDDSQPQNPTQEREIKSSHENLSEVSKSEESDHATENQFALLANDSATKDHHNTVRQVEVLNKTSSKIKLSKGQKCVILGLCSIWIKAGEVSIYGATLSASVQTYRLFAPTSHALPYIQALSQVAEFQIDTVDDGLRFLSDIGLRDLWGFPGNLVNKDPSFLLLGTSSTYDFKAPQVFRELDFGPWEAMLHGLTSSKSTIKQFTDLKNNPLTSYAKKRFLVCGRRSSGSSTFVRCLINRLLTLKSSDTLETPHGVLLLDLENHLPEMTPPGMISLIHLTKPILGPQFSHLLTMEAKDNRILKMHFIGDIDSTSTSAWCRDCIFDLIANKQGEYLAKGGRPLIINTPTWFPSVGMKFMNKIWSKLALTDIICLDHNSTPMQMQLLQPLADSSGCAVHFINGPSYHKLNPTWEHDLQMQSYFHISDYKFGRLWWSHSPVMAGGQRQICLQYTGDEAKIGGVILLSDGIVLEDTYDALENALVAVVSMKCSQPENTLQPRGDAEHNSQLWHQLNRAPDHAGLNAYRFIQRTVSEDIPRLMVLGDNLCPLEANTTECLGLAIVSSIDTERGLINLVTPIPISLLTGQADGDHTLVLVQPKVTIDGRFKTEWAWKELTLKTSNTNSQVEDDSLLINLSDSMSE